MTHGKTGKKSAYLLLDRAKSSLDFLRKRWSEVGILDSNPFLFAKMGTTTNIRGCDCLMKYAVQECKAKNSKKSKVNKIKKACCYLMPASGPG